MTNYFSRIRLMMGIAFTDGPSFNISTNANTHCVKTCRLPDCWVPEKQKEFMLLMSSSHVGYAWILWSLDRRNQLIEIVPSQGIRKD